VVASLIIGSLLLYIILAIRRYKREKRAQAMQEHKRTDVEIEFDKFQKFKKMEA
tara:strand:- start:90 stop:251 length:162 start_codon:yes stop_codon:yes gene_type:complete